jgi:hypothetical protein
MVAIRGLESSIARFTGVGATRRGVGPCRAGGLARGGSHEIDNIIRKLNLGGYFSHPENRATVERAVTSALENGLFESQAITLGKKIGEIAHSGDNGSAERAFAALPEAFKAAKENGLAPDQALDLIGEIVNIVTTRSDGRPNYGLYRGYADAILLTLPSVLPTCQKAHPSGQEKVDFLKKIIERARVHEAQGHIVHGGMLGDAVQEAFQIIPVASELGITPNEILLGYYEELGYSPIELHYFRKVMKEVKGGDQPLDETAVHVLLVKAQDRATADIHAYGDMMYGEP